MMEMELGKVLAKLDNIERDMGEAREARKRVYERIELSDQKIDRLTWRMNVLEATMNQHAPTIAEFLAYKQQVAGAGRLGKFLWFLGGIILSAAVTVSGWFHFTK